MTAGSPATAQPQPRGGRPRTDWLWFSAWAVTGAAAALGLISLGPIALGPALILGAALSRTATARRSRPGVLAGAGLVALFVAYVQRQGPGTTCWHTATAAGCDQHLDPIPWLVIGSLLLAGALVLQRLRRGQ